ncbi:MAG: hypothetical protein U0412_12245 [Nitrospira sp.]
MRGDSRVRDRVGIRGVWVWASLMATFVWTASPALAVPSETHEEKEANLQKQAKGGLFNKWTFDKDAVSNVPAGFATLSLGDSGEAVWRVEIDAGAPTPPNVLAVTAACEPPGCFQLLVAQGLEYEYPDLSVRFRTADNPSGIGGVALGVKDGRNFYAALVEPGAARAQVIRVLDGAVTVLGQTPIALKPIDWHSLRVQRNTIVSKDFIETFVDGVLVLSVEDQTLGTGQVGMVTQGKTAWFFDTFHAVPLFSHRPLSAPAAY